MCIIKTHYAIIVEYKKESRQIFSIHQLQLFF